MGCTPCDHAGRPALRAGPPASFGSAVGRGYFWIWMLPPPMTVPSVFDPSAPATAV